MNKVLIIVTCLFGLVVQTADAGNADIESHETGIWSITGTQKEQRWIIIHNLTEGKTTGVYHIEVIQRAVDAPAWQIVRLMKHMAITREALKRSIIVPLDEGAVYPEQFDDALAGWKAKNGGKGGSVCNTSVMECVPE